ncbi:hypothetical protein Sfulv_54360 [Streptomyces fulvorobeus]|uniref:AMP-dependent synthetase/ligase domain-containing protein n=1 Tax=Streptomyces fulvorobeus TaxID=284028 RepID=A0A7J0CDT5_9ACTN|nr:AMP-binding protein [Streptomyces fulvorobeus]GFN00626.1 hypothetical protein Sfulv_54360 [Streptomyces fulvorobeus]
MSEDRARAPGGLPDTLLNAVGRLAPDTGILPGRTAAELSAEAHRIAETLKDQGPEGEAVVLRLPNGPDWVTHFLGLLAAGARPLPVAPDTPDAEVRRLLGQAGGGRILTPAARPGGPPLLDGTPGTPASEGPGVLLPTSGSTGAPNWSGAPRPAGCPRPAATATASASPPRTSCYCPYRSRTRTPSAGCAARC